MRRIEVRGAAPIRDEIIEPVEIIVSGSFPDRDIKRLEDLGSGFEEDAWKIFDALSRTLPQGTLIRLTGLLLNKQALNCYLCVPDESSPAPEEKAVVDVQDALERIAAWDFDLDGDCVAEARALARAALKSAKKEAR